MLFDLFDNHCHFHGICSTSRYWILPGNAEKIQQAEEKTVIYVGDRLLLQPVPRFFARGCVKHPKAGIIQQ